MASLYDLLAEMQATTPRMEGEPESSRPYIEIDLNQRLIKLTSDFDPLLIVGDHYASRIWFCCDRFFDTVDLYDMAIAVLYKNPLGNYRIAPVYVVEKTEIDGVPKLFFSWEINGEAAPKAGELQFAVRFFSVDPATNQIVFSLNTETCIGKIAEGLGHPTSESDKDYGQSADNMTSLLAKMHDLEILLSEQSIHWWDLNPPEEEEEEE